MCFFNPPPNPSAASSHPSGDHPPSPWTQFQASSAHDWVHPDRARGLGGRIDSFGSQIWDLPYMPND